MSKIAVAMSGGVDSSVVAALLQEAGHEVIGVTLALWRGSLCCSFEDVAQAKEICRQLGIRHFLIEALDAFRTEIVESFVQARQQGQTPNPCVSCNKKFKFGILWERLLQRVPEVEFLASGHYARLNYNPASQRWEVFQGADSSKDQSYMLWQLSQEQLSRSLFPLGHLTKAQVRQEALRLGLDKVAAKPDSQDLCFLLPSPEVFWQTHAPEACQPGDIIDSTGKVKGRHQGRVFYTLGQRRGLGGGGTQPMYVAKIDPARNQIQIAAKEQLLSPELNLSELNWVSMAEPAEGLSARFKLSSQGRPVAGVMNLAGQQRASIQLEQPQMPVAQGQSIVFYDHQARLLGGGYLQANEAF